jgi:hypothetical protein
LKIDSGVTIVSKLTTMFYGCESLIDDVANLASDPLVPDADGLQDRRIIRSVCINLEAKRGEGFMPINGSEKTFQWNIFDVPPESIFLGPIEASRQQDKTLESAVMMTEIATKIEAASFTTGSFRG